MKKPNIKVTVNSGEHKGKTGLLVGYDRDKYYEVLFDDGSSNTFKGYYLDGINKLQGHQRYLLQYNTLDFTHPHNSKLTNVELAEDLRQHTRKGKGSNSSFRYFSIDIHRENGGEYYDDLSLQQLKKVIRKALHNKCSFDVRITSERKHSSISEGLLEFDYQGNLLYTFKTSKKNRKYLDTFIRSITKEIDKHY